MNRGQFPKSVPLQEEAQVVDTVMNEQNVSQQTFIQQVLRQILDYAFFLDSFYHARLNPPLTTIAPFDGALTSTTVTQLYGRDIQQTFWQTNSCQTQRNQTIETAHGKKKFQARLSV